MGIERHILTPIHDAFMERRSALFVQGAILIVPVIIMAWLGAKDWNGFFALAGVYFVGALKLMARNRVIGMVATKAVKNAVETDERLAPPTLDHVYYDDPERRSGRFLLDTFGAELEKDGMNVFIGQRLWANADKAHWEVTPERSMFRIESKDADAGERSMFKLKLLEFLQARGVLTSGGGGRINFHPTNSQ
ncbi:hypothetical protein [Sphingomicrobium sediminis]|uniref:Uncharacterized protein n=1 Tax=Sphingomicrobium sediminis TaxID=2950949 RepID=A0A9X2EGX1_9SPHN|nr:hypothetical protein [Sphingomicrobium sediminis]MCM8557300.1 hypothetical protein [Sphingomicrobium sediminis]